MNQNTDPLSLKNVKKYEKAKKKEFSEFKKGFLQVFHDIHLPQYKKNGFDMVLCSTIKANFHKEAKKDLFQRLEEMYFEPFFKDEFLQESKKELCSELEFLLNHTYIVSILGDPQLEKDFRDKAAYLNTYANTIVRNGDVTAQKAFSNQIQTILDEVYILDKQVKKQLES